MDNKCLVIAAFIFCLFDLVFPC